MKKINFILTLFCLVSITLLYGCSKGDKRNEMEIQPGDRVIQFAGYEWDVRANEANKQGPGPNYFSDKEENVWVDGAGKLHLKITQVNGVWHCAEVTLKKVYGHGRYIFQVDSPLETLDKNAIGALFLYKDDNHEIDIEFSKWGVANNDNAQFVIQPGDKSGNKQRFQYTDKESSSVHTIDWRQESVHFGSYSGIIADTGKVGNKVATWTYKGVDNPSDQDARLKINLWLFKGMAPSNQQAQELVISGFEIM